ncbi:hypothetical protein ACHAW6_000795 [Cyclotella cf. meneghiniana]
MIQKWVTGIERLATVATRFPHSAYAGLVLCLSAEWQYICQTIQDVGPSLAPVENALCKKFLPAVLGIDGTIDDELRTCLGNEVKTKGLAIRDPTLTAAFLYSTSVEATDMLAGTFIQTAPINVKAHQNCVCSADAKHRKTRRDGEVTFHIALMERLPPKVKKWMEHATAAGEWLSTIVDRFSCTELTKDEWLDNVAIRYGRRPDNLPDQYDGCDAGLTLEHGLSCMKGGLVGIHHDDPLQATHPPPPHAAPSQPTPLEMKHVEMSLLTDSGTMDKELTSMSASGTLTPAPTATPPQAKFLRVMSKKRKTSTRLHASTGRDFTPLVDSVDRMASKDAQTAEQCIAWLLAKKWSRTYLGMASLIHTRMSLAIVQSNTLLLRGNQTNPLR